MEDELDPGEDIIVRALQAGDLDAVVGIDARGVGHRRDAFFRLKLNQALQDTGIALSLAAEVDGAVVGFLLARVYYGEFGVTEKVASLDAIGVHPDFQGRRIGTALLAQLKVNLEGLGIRTLRTEVAWDNPGLVAFFNREGFVLAPRLSLDLNLAR